LRKKKSLLAQAVKCKSLNRYYFESVSSLEINEFIKQDVKFIAEYGYSVIDAIFIENTQYYSWNGGFNEIHL